MEQMKRLIAISTALACIFAGVAIFGQKTATPNPNIQYFNNSGNPCAGCKLYTYVAGGTTPQNTFTTAAGSSPNANPVILNSAGRANVWTTPGQSYRFDLYDPNGVLLWTVDNIPGGSLAGTSNVTANYVFAGPTTGAAATPTFRPLVGADIPNLSNITITGTFNASGVSTFTLPKSAGATAAASGTIAYDTTLNQLHAGINSTDRILPYTSTAVPTPGTYAVWGANRLLSATSSPMGMGVTEADLQSGTLQFCASVTGNDTYTCGLSTALTTYTDGQPIYFSGDTLSTGAASLNIDGLGAKNLYASDGTSNPAVLANVRYLLSYDASLNGAAGGFRMPYVPSASTGALILLEQHSASTSASLSFTSWYSSSYDEYQVEVVNLIPATSTAELYLQFNSDTMGNYGWAGSRFSPLGETLHSGAGSGLTQISLTASGSPSNSANYGVRGTFKLFDPASSIYKGINGDFSYLESTVPTIESVKMIGFYLTATAVTTMQFTESSGNIASGTIRVYGIAK